MECTPLVAQTVQPTELIAASYDANGEMKTLGSAGNPAVTFTYDAEGRVTGSTGSGVSGRGVRPYYRGVIW